MTTIERYNAKHLIFFIAAEKVGVVLVACQLNEGMDRSLSKKRRHSSWEEESWDSGRSSSSQSSLRGSNTDVRNGRHSKRRASTGGYYGFGMHYSANASSSSKRRVSLDCHSSRDHYGYHGEESPNNNTSCMRRVSWGDKNESESCSSPGKTPQCSLEQVYAGEAEQCHLYSHQCPELRYYDEAVLERESLANKTLVCYDLPKRMTESTLQQRLNKAMYLAGLSAFESVVVKKVKCRASGVFEIEFSSASMASRAMNLHGYTLSDKNGKFQLQIDRPETYKGRRPQYRITYREYRDTQYNKQVIQTQKDVERRIVIMQGVKAGTNSKEMTKFVTETMRQRSLLISPHGSPMTTCSVKRMRAYCTFRTEEEAKVAIEQLDGIEFNGSSLRVYKNVPLRDSSRTHTEGDASYYGPGSSDSTSLAPEGAVREEHTKSMRRVHSGMDCVAAPTSATLGSSTSSIESVPAMSCEKDQTSQVTSSRLDK